MAKLSGRQILARNLAHFMERSANLKSNNRLAKEAKVAHSHIGRILDQTSAATVDMLDAIAKALGIEVWELLADAESTRQAVWAKMVWGDRVPDEKAAAHLPPAPHLAEPKPKKKTTKGRKRKHGPDASA